MDIETITKLIDAGYTKEEIDKLSAGNTGTVPEKDEVDTTGAEAEKSKEQGAGDSAHDSAVTTEMLQTLTSTVQGLQETVKALQAQNAKTADSGTKKPADPIKETIESFINTL